MWNLLNCSKRCTGIRLIIKSVPIGAMNSELKLTEHKSARVLSATVDEIQSRRENPIRQVTDADKKVDENGISKTLGTGDETKGGRERKTARSEKDQNVKSSERMPENATRNVVSLTF